MSELNFVQLFPERWQTNIGDSVDGCTVIGIGHGGGTERLDIRQNLFNDERKHSQIADVMITVVRIQMDKKGIAELLTDVLHSNGRKTFEVTIVVYYVNMFELMRSPMIRMNQFYLK